MGFQWHLAPPANSNGNGDGSKRRLIFGFASDRETGGASPESSVAIRLVIVWEHQPLAPLTPSCRFPNETPSPSQACFEWLFADRRPRCVWRSPAPAGSC